MHTLLLLLKLKVLAQDESVYLQEGRLLTFLFSPTLGTIVILLAHFVTWDYDEYLIHNVTTKISSAIFLAQ